MRIQFEERMVSTRMLGNIVGFQYLRRSRFEAKKEVYKKGLESSPTQQEKEMGRKFIAKIRSHYIPPVSVRWIDAEVGYGLFAEAPIEQECYIGEYTGLVRAQNDPWYEESNDAYFFRYPITDALGRCYLIDASEGNFTRFINHSDSPNLESISAYYRGYYHVIFLTMHRIEKGKQLLVHYGKEYWSCGRSPSCKIG